MPKIILDKTNCIGCGSCTIYAEDYFEMNTEGHAKAQLTRGEKHGEIETLNIEEFETEEPIQAAQGCPSQCIQVLDDAGKKLV